MASDFDHVIVTRFNLPSEGFESLVRAKEGWLRDRIELFERYCLPSVQSQKNQAFHWLIYFDPASPEWLKRRVQKHADDKAYIPIFRPSIDVTELVSEIRNITGGDGARLITTRLDNDDALAVDFVDRLQESAPKDGRAAIYFARGLIKSDTHLYLRLDKRNAFASVVEDWTSPSTCWSGWHSLLGKRMRSFELYGDPAWLQVVHGGNISNRVRGRMVSPSRYSQLFPGLIDDTRTPRWRELAIDVLAAQPRRLVRDSGPAVVKNMVMRFWGQDAVDQVKRFLAARGWHNL